MNAHAIRKVLPLVVAIFIAGIMSEALSQPFSLSGYVRTSRGAVISGVTMDGLPRSPVTDENGFYIATVEYRWSGTVMPSLLGYTFNPQSLTYSNVSSNQTNQNYIGTFQTITFSGHVLLTTGGPLSGVSMSGLPGPPLTDATGFFAATLPFGWSGTVHPTLPGYDFVPSARSYYGLTSDHTNDDWGAYVRLAVGSRDEAPPEYYLHQNSPNPFNPSTTIEYELPKSSEVRLSVYDILGREVSVLVNDRRDAGVHEVKFDAAGLSSGVYFYRLQAGDFVQSRKLLLLK